MPPKAKSPARPAAGKAPAKPAGSAAVASAAKAATAKKEKEVPPKEEKKATEPKAITNGQALVLQRFGRGFSDRQYAGSLFARRLRDAAAHKGEIRAERFFTHQTRRDKNDRSIADAERAKRERQVKLQDDLNVAAFDGDESGVKKALASGAILAKKDASGNYALGEAAVNNQVDLVKKLIALGADPNCKGQFDRTPLWRAAYNSHAGVISVLLEAGADPRLKAQQEAPIDKASGDAAKVLTSWDITKTEKLFASAEASRLKAEDIAKKEADVVKGKMHDATATAQLKYENSKAQLQSSKMDYERRIVELDLVMHDATKPQELRAIQLASVKSAEENISKLEAEMDGNFQAFMDAKVGEQNALGEQVAGPEVIEVTLGKIQEVVFADSGGHMKKFPEKWPLLVDVTGRCGVFFRYRDTNLIDSFQASNMKPGAIRKSVLGSLRYGKPLIIDLNDVPMLSIVRDGFNAVDSSLWANIMNKTIRTPEVFTKLIRQPEDGEAYKEAQFTTTNLDAMTVVFLTSAIYIEDELLQTFVTFVVPPPE